jgi:hypothetical protein
MSAAEFTVPMIFSVGMLILMVRSFTPFHRPAKVRPQAIAATLNCTPLFSKPLAPQSQQHELVASDPAVATRQALSKYRDIDVAIADGYRFPIGAAAQSRVHLTNHWHAFKSAFGFDPEHPTCLVYEKANDGGYVLRGATFTAPARFAPEQLEARIPSTIAKWRKHELFGWAAEVYIFHPGDNSSNAA